jgi:hypothetical protein
VTPRCAEPMRRYEACNGALPDGPWCGRPAAHNGPHRSVQALERQRPKDRVKAARRERSRRLHARLRPVVELAAAQARERSRAA